MRSEANLIVNTAVSIAERVQTTQAVGVSNYVTESLRAK